MNAYYVMTKIPGAQIITFVMYSLNRKTDLESEEIVSELVHTFLLPEVQKETLRAQIRQKQRKYLLAAHKEIVKEANPIMETHPGKFANQQQQ